MTVVFEGAYEVYCAHNLGNTIMLLRGSCSSVDRAGLACILHSVPEAIAKGNMKDVVQKLRNVAGSVFVTESAANYYSSFGGYWKMFVDEMAGGE